MFLLNLVFVFRSYTDSLIDVARDSIADRRQKVTG
jgi:hypothetical protein